MIQSVESIKISGQILIDNIPNLDHTKISGVIPDSRITRGLIVCEYNLPNLSLMSGDCPMNWSHCCGSNIVVKAGDLVHMLPSVFIAQPRWALTLGGIEHFPLSNTFIIPSDGGDRKSVV